MTTNKVVINETVARFMPRPFIARTKRGRKEGINLTEIFNANRNVIAKLRQRHFSWTEIHHVLKNFGVSHSYLSLHLWKKKNYKNI